MSIQNDRALLFEKGVTRTMTGRELFRRYYCILEEIAKDLEKSQVKEVSISENKILFKTEEEIVLNYSFGDVGMISQWLILPGSESGEKKVIENILEIFSLLKKDFTFFDIGANIGWYSLWIGKKYPECKVFAFEPAPAAFEQIKINLQLNEIANIEAFNMGFADTPGKKEFFFCEEIQTASSLADTLPDTIKRKIQCDFDTVDSFCCKQNCSPDFIKCDVEGAEYLVMKGAGRILSDFSPVLMLEMLRKWMKCFNVHPNDLIEKLEQYGYRCYAVDQENTSIFRVIAVDENTTETNFFFLHPEKHKKILEKLCING